MFALHRRVYKQNLGYYFRINLSIYTFNGIKNAKNFDLRSKFRDFEILKKTVLARQILWI